MKAHRFHVLIGLLLICNILFAWTITHKKIPPAPPPPTTVLAAPSSSPPSHASHPTPSLPTPSHPTLPPQPPEGSGVPPSVQKKILRWAVSRDLKTWIEIPSTMTGVSSPQILWFTGQLKTLCASATRIHWVTLSTSRDGPIKAGPLKLVEIEGETSLIQVDPCVVALPNGGYRLYYTTTSDNCDPAYQTTEFHSAIWSSNHWKREPGRRLSGVGFVDPDVFRLPDGRWQMLFTHGFGHTIGSAVSTNGLDFTETAGQRIFGQVTATTPLANGYLTAYQSFGGRFGQGLLHVARSRDGVTFTKDPDFTWPEKPIQTESPSITLLTDKRFIMTYVTAKTLKAAPEHPTSERPAASPAH